MGRLKTLAPRLTALGRPLRPAGSGEDGQRRKTQPGAHLYCTARWQDVVERIRVRDNLRCRKTGVMLIGKYPAPNSPVVDHIIPHEGDETLFWDEDNLQLVSKAWHDAEKQRTERRARR